MSETDDRLARLEARIAQLEAAAVMPSYSPTSGQTIAADGSVTYDFDGHVHARGVDFTAPGVTNEAQAVNWLEKDTGRHFADVFAMPKPASGGPDLLELSAGLFCFIQLQDGAGDATDGIWLRAGSAVKKLLGHDGTSDFVLG
jgi:hypothetical protein